MPIAVPVRLHRLSENEFKQTDYEVMGHVFASHKELGRLYDEAIYRNDLADTLEFRTLGQ